MLQTINGWTKAKMIKHIKANFRGKSHVGEGNDDSGRCLYRGPNGAKCAIGLFIPDDRYNPQMDDIDNASVRASVVIATYDLEEFMPLDRMEMQRLQGVHDCSDEANTLRDMIKWVKENVEG
jgi:hypothetical protein